jgi:hypothetical protein
MNCEVVVSDRIESKIKYIGTSRFQESKQARVKLNNMKINEELKVSEN